MSQPSVIAENVYKMSPTYLGIYRRFLMHHSINLNNHIHSVTKLGRRVEEGFDFIPISADKFENAVKAARFELDKRERHLGFIPSIGTIAALATNGEGYREKGSPSLHCAISPSRCNVHLDNYGFRCMGYGPNSGQHVADELIWQAMVVPLLGKLLPQQAVDVLQRFHPVVPNSRQFKPFSQIGVEFDVMTGRSADLQTQWRVTLDLTHSCSDWSCGTWAKLNGKKVDGENRAMVMFKVVGM